MLMACSCSYIVCYTPTVSSQYCWHIHTTLCAAPQVTDAMKQYVEGKIAHAVQRYSQILREIDVTVSARGGDTGTHGPK
jgi:hypothetical protein